MTPQSLGVGGDGVVADLLGVLVIKASDALELAEVEAEDAGHGRVAPRGMRVVASSIVARDGHTAYMYSLGVQRRLAVFKIRWRGVKPRDDDDPLLQEKRRVAIAAIERLLCACHGHEPEIWINSYSEPLNMLREGRDRDAILAE